MHGTNTDVKSKQLAAATKVVTSAYELAVRCPAPTCGVVDQVGGGLPKRGSKTMMVMVLIRTWLRSRPNLGGEMTSESLKGAAACTSGEQLRWTRSAMRGRACPSLPGIDIWHFAARLVILVSETLLFLLFCATWLSRYVIFFCSAYPEKDVSDTVQKLRSCMPLCTAEDLRMHVLWDSKPCFQHTEFMFLDFI